MFCPPKIVSIPEECTSAGTHLQWEGQYQACPVLRLTCNNKKRNNPWFSKMLIFIATFNTLKWKIGLFVLPGQWSFLLHTYCCSRTSWSDPFGVQALFFFNGCQLEYNQLRNASSWKRTFGIELGLSSHWWQPRQYNNQRLDKQNIKYAVFY